MKTYELKFSNNFEKDKELLRKSGNIQLLKKLAIILRELVEHPTTGIGKPKQLSGDRDGQWSRRISDKHRLIYMIDNEKVIVLLLSAYGIMMINNLLNLNKTNNFSFFFC